MNSAQPGNPPTATFDDKGELGILDLMIVLAKHKKLIVRTPFIVALVAAAISFALPNIYNAKTTVVLPQAPSSGASALLAQLGGVAGMAVGAGVLKNPGDLYVGMLKSRTIADSLIAQFDLKAVYDVELKQHAREILEANTAIAAGKDGLITVSVEDEDRELAAKLANSYVSELLKLSRVLAVTEAAQRRVFFEGQLENAKNKLAAAEVALKKTLSTGGVISVDGESRAVVETVAILRAQVSAKEIQLNSMRAVVTVNHPEYKRVREDLNSLRSELARLEYGRGERRIDEVQSAPSGLKNIQQLRDVKYHQMLYELLAKQYEAARLDEANEPSVIQVLDPAVVPEQKAKPKRVLIVLVAALLALGVSILAAFLIEFAARARKSSTDAAQWQKFRGLMRWRS